MQSIKIRSMVQFDLSTGCSSKTEVNVPCTLAHYIRALHNLNKGAFIYGVVYLPDETDEEYLEFIK